MLMPRVLHGAFACACIAACVLFNQSSVHWRENIADDHLYAYGGWRILHGATPYLGVWDNKPPGVWWLNAGAFAICGEGLGPDLLLGTLALVTLIVAFTAAARALYGPAAFWPGLVTGGVLLTHLQFECGSNRTETFVAVAEVVAVAAYLRWFTGGRMRWLFAAGIAAGAAPWFKQNGVAVIAALAVHLIAAGRQGSGKKEIGVSSLGRRMVVFALGVSIVPMIAIVALTSQGALGEFYNAVLVFNRYFFIAGDATWVHIGRPIQLYWSELVQIWKIPALAVVGLTIGLVSVPLRRRVASVENGHALWLIGLWLGLDLYLACVATGRLAYHLAPVLTPLGLLALQPLMALLGRQQLAARLTARPLLVATTVAFGFLLFEVLAQSWSAGRPGWFEKPAWYALERKQPTAYEAQAAAIRAWTKPDDYVYVWGWSPGTYRFAYRRCPSRFATIEHVSHVYPYGNFIAEGAQRDVLVKPPAVFVISISDYPALIAPPVSSFAAWFEAHYSLRETISGMNLFVRRGARYGADAGTDAGGG